MKSMSKILWGMVLIIVGLMLAINALGFAHIDIFFDGWWTLFIIIPSLIGLVDGKDRYGSFIGLIIGATLLLSAQGFISIGLVMKLVVPFIIVLIGLSVLQKGLFGEKVKEKVEIKDSDDFENIAVVMADDYKVIKGEFKGAIVETVFGHSTIDLSDAKIRDNASIKISSIFSKTDIILPEGVTLKMNSTRVFGSVTNVVKDTKATKKDKNVYVEAVAVFGGIFLR